MRKKKPVMKNKGLACLISNTKLTP